jgi:fumagillin biosynthesis monooxygenase
LPVIAVLLHTVVTIALQVRDPKNPYMHGVVNTRTSAQLPRASYDPNSKDAPLFAPQASSQGVVVLLLGFRISSPLGLLSRGAKQVGDGFARCQRDLAARREEFGYLGQSSWSSSEMANNSTMMQIIYFRNVEGLNKFAHDKVHREVWDDYNKMIKQEGYEHLGVFHETYFAGPSQYETIYVNMPPVLLGATNVKTQNLATGEEEWVRPLVDGNNTVLRSQWGRMGRAVKEDGHTYDA